MAGIKRVPQLIGTALTWLFVMIFGDRFKMVYWIISAATAQHTAWGAAVTMQGMAGANKLDWWAQGFAFAIGIDFLMVMVATKIRSGVASERIQLGPIVIPFNMYIPTFIIVAALSSYFQLLYAWNHMDTLTIGAGVSVDWKATLEGLVNARIVIAPLALPLVATLYTLGGIGKGGEKTSSRNSTGIPRGKRLEVFVPAIPAKTGNSKGQSERVREYLLQPGAMDEKPLAVSKKLGIPKSTVYDVRNKILNGGYTNGHDTETPVQ